MKNYNIDSGTKREELQDRQAKELHQIPTIWNSNEFALVAGRLLLVSLGSNIAASLIQWAATVHLALALWATLVYGFFAIGGVVWMLANHNSVFHRWSFIASIWVGICFGVTLHGVLS